MWQERSRLRAQIRCHDGHTEAVQWGWAILTAGCTLLHTRLLQAPEAPLCMAQVYQASPQTLLPVMPHLLAELTAREDARRARPYHQPITLLD